MSSVPTYPPRRDAESSLVSRLEGSVISNAPSKLSAKIPNTIAMNPFTHGFEPNCTTPNGPTAAETPNPSRQNSTTIPSENTSAWTSPPRWFKKNDTVIGIIGKTHGVKIAASPKPNAVSKNVPMLASVWTGAAAGAVVVAAAKAPGLTSE
jgi:hypothetical protein